MFYITLTSRRRLHAQSILSIFAYICVRICFRHGSQTPFPTPTLPASSKRSPLSCKKDLLLDLCFHPTANMQLQRRKPNHDTPSPQPQFDAKVVKRQHTCKRRPARGSCSSGATAGPKAVMPPSLLSIDLCKRRI